MAEQANGMLIGVFVGGKSERMGGEPKGLLRAPDGPLTLVERLREVTRAALPDAEFVLVGDAEPYERLGIKAISDDPGGQGPLAGLLALLGEAERRGHSDVIACACDLPYVSVALVEKLGEHAPGAHAVAPRADGVWQPLCARYRVAAAQSAARSAAEAGESALQQVLDRLKPTELPLDANELKELRDWDTPADMKR